DLAGEAIMMLDLKTKTYFDVNQKAQKMYGYSKKEFLKLGHQDIDGDFKAKTDKQWEKLVKEIKKKGDRFIVFGVNRRKNGTTFPVEAFFNYNRFDNQQYLLVMVRDITERIKAEEEKRTLAAAIEQTGESIIITDTEGIIQYVNPAFQKITGYSIKETLGKKPSLTKSDKHDREYFHQLWQTIKNGDTWRGRLINKRKNGSLYEEETTISPIRDEKGELKNFVAVKRDMTYQNKLEKQLRESQKLEAIGTLAGGLAHDFNNILCSILGYITLAKDEMLKNNPSRSDLEMALQAGEYAKDLIAKILAFSHQNESEFRPVKLPMILLESLKMLRPMLPSTIEIKNTIPQEDLNILADPIQIQQVIMNLCTNSGYAMKDRGGILSIDIVEVELDSKIADLREITPGSYVKVQIKDTGSGIHPKHLNRIFDPFFTTKPVDQGTGLGMAVVHGIVKNHQGAILVKSALNAGTTVEIYFPKIDTPEVPLVDENLRGQRGNEKILLVDDENLIVLLLKKALGKMGYKITTADNALNALELFNDPEMDFDLVITDQTMPKMTGLQLSKKILKKNPKTPIILMTGFDPNLTSDKARSVGIKAFVTKPILPNKLSRIIRSVLDEEKVSAH
ncbi:MAG: PAS domain S-box protein, partial [Deltaproteobacteria bacterium]|nr:PAS domain S-box protein [Deltaproteobacteria bacterium]